MFNDGTRPYVGFPVTGYPVQFHTKKFSGNWPDRFRAIGDIRSNPKLKMAKEKDVTPPPAQRLLQAKAGRRGCFLSCSALRSCPSQRHRRAADRRRRERYLTCLSWNCPKSQLLLLLQMMNYLSRTFKMDFSLVYLIVTSLTILSKIVLKIFTDIEFCVFVLGRLRDFQYIFAVIYGTFNSFLYVNLLKR